MNIIDFKREFKDLEKKQADLRTKLIYNVQVLAKAYPDVVVDIYYNKPFTAASLVDKEELEYIDNEILLKYLHTLEIYKSLNKEQS